MIKITTYLLLALAFSLPLTISGKAMAQSAEEIAIYKKDLKRIESYLNGIKTLIAPFTQIDSEEVESEGTFYLSRPGKLRWEYLPPTPILIIAKGSLMTYYDSELDQVSHVGLDDNISGFLTRKNISFSDEKIEIIRFDKTNDEIRVAIAQKGQDGEGMLTLVFDDKKTALKRMEILDAIGKTTKVTFTTLIYDKKLENSLFTLQKLKKP